MTASALIRHSPLEHWTDQFAMLAPSVVVGENAYRTQLTIRARPSDTDNIGAALGITPPTKACTSSHGLTHIGALDILWLGPDEYLVLAPADRQNELEASLTNICSSVVDTSAQRTVLELAGPRARDVLRHGCAIDLHPTAAPSGTCVQTLIARTGAIVLVRNADSGEFSVLVRASFADYLAAWIVDASSEYLAD